MSRRSIDLLVQCGTETIGLRKHHRKYIYVGEYIAVIENIKPAYPAKGLTILGLLSLLVAFP
jgi:hypothetical protein